MVKLSKLYKENDGSGLIICIFILFVLFAVGALVVDVGILYKTKGEMRKAANAAALSGAQEILNDDVSVTNEVDYILEAHNEKSSLRSLQIKPGGENKVTVTLAKDEPTYFMKIFNINDVYLEVTSSAVAGPLGGASGVIPLGLPDDFSFEIGKDYSLNYTSENAQKGNFGYLNFNRVYKPDGITIVTDSNAPNGEGADTLKYFIEKGFGPEIGYNYIVYTEPGMNKNKVEDGIDTRIGKTVIIPIYEPEQLNGQTIVRIIGFSFFNIKGIDKHSNLVTGTFIKKVTSGSVNDSAKDSGAYGIKLVE